MGEIVRLPNSAPSRLGLTASPALGVPSPAAPAAPIHPLIVPFSSSRNDGVPSALGPCAASNPNWSMTRRARLRLFSSSYWVW